MQTLCGPRCDVCGRYILPVTGEGIALFNVRGIEETLMAHDPACKQLVLDAGNDWRNLPEGPLRAAFEEANSPL